MLWIGVDIGGTFTDVVAYDTDNRRKTASKTLSDRNDPVSAVLAGLEKLNLDLKSAARFVHGTTRVTNALLEGDRVPTAILTTKGFRDVVEMGRGHRPNLYSVKERPPPSLIPRHLRLEVDERLAADGSILRALDDDDVALKIDSLPKQGIGGVAVCFLHSYANPEHERRVAALVADKRPDLAVSLSADVVPEIGEYERFATTVLNVSVQPVVDTYLASLEGRLNEQGFPGELFVMTSAGGAIQADQARQTPIQLALSGPAGGVAACVELARRAGFPNVITCDMGGTSTDVCLIEDGFPTMTNQGEIAGWPNRTFQIEIETIGAGGGSIAWRDIGGELNIGPASAGSTPGPACYGRGGSKPTITDAHLAVGHLDEAVLLGDEVTLDRGRAQDALATLLREFGASEIEDLSTEALALGIIRLATAKMTSAIKAISISRGHDTRDFTLLPFGGAGPMHATMLAEELGIDEILVPPVPGNLSALGFITARARVDLVRTMPRLLDNSALEPIRDAFDALEREGLLRMVENGVEDATLITRKPSIGMRIKGQSFELIVPVDLATYTVDDLSKRFRDAYESRYAYLPPGGTFEVVSCRLTLLGPTPDIASSGASSADTTAGTRQIFARTGWCAAAVHPRATISMGDKIDGPAVITESSATTIVGAGWRAEIDDFDNLLLRRIVSDR